MPDTNIGSSSASDLANAFTDYSEPSASTDGSSGDKEFTYQNVEWNRDYGYYLEIASFKKAVDTMTLWTLGAGVETDEETSILLNNVKGNGNDTFHSILSNSIKVKTISKDSFSEVIRDSKGVLVNLKPLDPSSMIIVQNSKGRIVRYEQVTKTKTPNKKFSPDKIFHLSHERIADNIHGTSIINALKWVIDARDEAMKDWRTVLHRNVKPMRIWYLDTDEPGEIAEFKRKTDQASADTENMYVPKGTVETEIASVAPNQTLNPLAWIDMLDDKFFQDVGVPQILFGNAKGFTDASGKIVYLAFEQTVKSNQIYIEEQVLSQLNLEIQLTFPASLQNDLISEKEKDPMTSAAAPNDTTTEMEGKQ